MSCGYGDKDCSICFNAGGCLAATYEDYYAPATRQQVEERLEQGKYSNSKEIMIKYLKNLKETPIEQHEPQYCCISLRDINPYISKQKVIN